MIRYVAIAKRPAPKAYWDEPTVQPLGHPSVYVSDPVATGVLDKDGNPIYRFPDQIGFVRTEDES